MSDNVNENVIRGHKANLSNPNTSEESKERSREIIEDATADTADATDDTTEPESNYSLQSTDITEQALGGKDPANVARGHKANLNNPNTSDEAKQNSQLVLEELGVAK